MSCGQLAIDLHAIAANWRALDALSAARVETAAVVKADAYGLGAAPVAGALARAGARQFFVAMAEEGAALRAALGPGPKIGVFSGHMEGDAGLIGQAALVPMLNDPAQLQRHRDALPDAPYGIQLDCGMNRLGMEPADWQAVRGDLPGDGPALVMSHLACADEPGHPMNAGQLALFRDMAACVAAPKSLSATGGILLGPAYHFDMVRPGIGLYGGLPFEQAEPVVGLALPVVQTRDVAPGETVGYGNTWTAGRPTRLATVASGYADGILRGLSGNFALYAGNTACPVVGRVSMDLLTVDVTGLAEVPAMLSLLNARQGVDALAEKAGTIGYEFLTAMGQRYARSYGTAP